MSRKRDVITVTPYGDKGEYFAVSVGYTPIGLIEKRADGYLPSGRRKTVATLEMAALESVWTRVRRSLKDAADWSKLVNEDAVDVSALSPSLPASPEPK